MSLSQQLLDQASYEIFPLVLQTLSMALCLQLVQFILKIAVMLCSRNLLSLMTDLNTCVVTERELEDSGHKYHCDLMLNHLSHPPMLWTMRSVANSFSLPFSTDFHNKTGAVETVSIELVGPVDLLPISEKRKSPNSAGGAWALRLVSS